MKLEGDNPTRLELHNLRFDAILHQCPKLAHCLFAGRSADDAGYSADGRRVLTVSKLDRSLRVWDAATGQPITSPLTNDFRNLGAELSPDGSRLVAYDIAGRAPQVWDATTGALLLPALADDRVGYATFSPDSRSIATAGRDGTARVWDAATGQPVSPALKDEGELLHVAFSPEGDRVVACGQTAARVWNKRTGEALTSPLKPPMPISYATFSPDGRRVLTAQKRAYIYTKPAEAIIWDAATGEQVAPALPHGSVTAASFSPDGSRVLTASLDGTARLWDATTGQPVAPPLKHNRDVYHAAFSPDGRKVVTASMDQTVRIWDAVTGSPLTPLLWHPGKMPHATFSPNGQFVLSACDDGVVRIWDLATEELTTRLLKHNGWVLTAAFSPDGTRVISGGTDRTARLWDAVSGKPLCPSLDHRGQIREASFSPDGRLLVTASGDGTAQVWDGTSGQRVGTPLPHKAEVYHAGFSPDGRRVVTASDDGTARVWEAATGRPITPPIEHGYRVWHASFSPDGSRIVTASGRVASRAQARVWDAASGQPVTPPLKHNHAVLRALFSPDGRLILTASWDATAQLWNAATGERIGPPLRHGSTLFCAGFSPDGRRVLTASSDTTARVWDTLTGQPVCPPLKHNDIVWQAAFSPDGRLVVTASKDQTARVWDAATGEPLTPALKHEGQVRRAEFNSDGLRVLTASTDGAVRIWNLSRVKRSPEDCLALAQVLTGHQIDRTGGISPLPPATLQEHWRKLGLAAAGGPAGKAERARLWHDQEVLDCERAQNWLGAAFHLQRLLELSPGDPDLRQHHELVQARLEREDKAPFARRVPGRDPRARPELIDLSPHYNALLTEGWLPPLTAERIRDSSLSSLPRGLQSFAETEFDVRGLIQLSSTVLEKLGGKFPAEVKGIALGRRCRRLFFLHGTTGQIEAPNLAEGEYLGSYVLHYANRCQLVVPIIYGQEMRQLYADPTPLILQHRALAWVGTNAQAQTLKKSLFLYKLAWDNPLPDLEITSLDFKSAMGSFGPFLIALTVEHTLWAQAEALERAGRLGEALEAMQPASQARPQNPDFWAAWGAMLEKTNRLAEACDAYTKAIALAADAPGVAPQRRADFFTRRFELLSRLGRTDAAAADLDAAVKLLPADALTLNNFAWYLVAGPGEHPYAARALPAAKKAVELKPDYANLDTLGVVYYRLGESDKAAETMLAALAALGSQAPSCSTLFVLAMSCHRLGQTAKATQYYDQAITRRNAERARNPETESFFTEAQVLLSQAGYKPPAPLPLAQSELAKQIPPRDSQAVPEMLDLTPHYNGSLTEGWIPSSAYGTTKGRNLGGLPRGVQELAGVRFDVRGLIQLAGRSLNGVLGAAYPAEVRGVAVKRKCRRLHFLHGTGWRVEDGVAIGQYVIHYGDGQTQQVAIIYGENVRDWWFNPKLDPPTSRAVVAWTGKNAALRDKEMLARVYRFTWENPRPEAEISSMDLISANTSSSPFVIAITAER